MHIENILSFIYIYRYGSFHKAASALYVTQPSLSSRIHTLEKDLNAQLLLRDRTRLELTEEGKTFLPYAMQMVNTYNQARMALNKNRSKLVIGANVSLSVTLLPHVIQGFRQKYPDVTIEIYSGTPEVLEERLLAKQCDLILTQDVEHAEFEREVVYLDPLELIVPPGHVLARRGRVYFTELALEPMIYNPRLPAHWERIQAHFKKQGVAPNFVLDVDSLEVTKKMIMKGIGITYLPLLSIEQELLQQELVVVRPMPRLELYREIYLLYNQEVEPPYREQIVEMIGKYGNERV